MKKIILTILILLIPSISFASWNAYIMDSSIKYRPWDTTPTTTSLTLNAVRGQWACFQVACNISGEDVTGVNIAVTTPAKGEDSLNVPIIYKEISYNVIVKSRDDGVIGEWFDPLVPKVDAFFSEERNVFPFNINRISSSWPGTSTITYAVFDINPSLANPITRTNIALTKPTMEGTYSGGGQLNYHIKIDGAGAKGVATFKWSDDGGSTWDDTEVLTGDAISLNNGLTITFAVQDYTVDDEWEFFANTSRTDMIWVDIFIPTNAVIGTYTGTATVSATAKDNIVLNYTINVKNLTIPLTSSVPIQYGSSRDGIAFGHYGGWQSSAYEALYKDYVESGLNHRLSITKLNPTPVWNGSSITNWSTYSDWLAPYMDGSWSMGSSFSGYRITVATATPSHGNDYNNTLYGSTIYASDLTQDEIDYLTALKTGLDTYGWTSKFYTILAEEPGGTGFPTSEQTAAVEEVSSDLHGVGFKTIATKRYVSQWAGGPIDAWNPWLGMFDTYPRTDYNSEIAAGRQLWTYLSCMSHGCNITGNSTYNKWPSHAVDATLPNLRGYYWMMSDNDVTGDLYWGVGDGYRFYYTGISYRHDPWDSMYDFGADGDGTLFFPGRPDKIGGTNDIPVETIRLKALRMGLEDYEIFKIVKAAGYSAYVTSQIENAIGSNKYYYDTPADYDVMAVAMETARNNIIGQYVGENPGEYRSVTIGGGSQSITIGGGPNTISW